MPRSAMPCSIKKKRDALADRTANLNTENKKTPPVLPVHGEVFNNRKQKRPTEKPTFLFVCELITYLSK